VVAVIQIKIESNKNSNVMYGNKSNKLDDDSNINDVLPSEIIVKILGYVEIDRLGPLSMGTPSRASYLGVLCKCWKCEYFQKKCVHIHPDEQANTWNLRLVCKYWNTLISLHFKYEYWKSHII
jgi:hypothetical protein